MASNRREQLQNWVRIALRGVAAGWAVLLGLYLVELPLDRWAAPSLGPAWFPSAIVALQCCALAVAGRVCGRAAEPLPLAGTICFAATLTLRDFNPLVPMNVPWLLRLAQDAMRDSRYVESLLSTCFLHALVFGCIFWGGLSRPRPQASPLSGL